MSIKGIANLADLMEDLPAALARHMGPRLGRGW